MRNQRFAFSLLILAWMACGSRLAAAEPSKTFRAGAACVDVSPTKLPVLVNGGFLQAQSNEVRDPLNARALVLDDGVTRLAMVVVDSCMIPRELLDKSKEIACDRTKIATDRILISATHTHSAPAAMGALGCAPDSNYIKDLPDRIAESIAKAVANLAPARIGWGSLDDYDHTHNRRWIRRPDKLIVDPFGKASAHAHMHPGYLNPDAIGPSGPVDPGLSVLSVQSPEGRPIAILANYSMHYFGTSPVSADYFGKFATKVKELVHGNDAFVGIMSQGTSGDQHWMDYGKAQKAITLDKYAAEMANTALKAYKSIVYQDHVSLAMAETTIKLHRRVPDEARLAWARPIVAAMGDRPAKNLPEVYAKEAIYLHDEPVRELKLQAIRIGNLGIAAIPNEVYALTGLKIKARSPLAANFTIELANGSEGYIPPAEQHKLGGYTTWPARTAALEVQAEPKITETVLTLLEKVAGKSRKTVVPVANPYSRSVLASKPWAYWQLSEMDGQSAYDTTGQGHDGRLEDGYALYLDGPDAPGFSSKSEINRAVHLVGGRITSTDPGPNASVEFWFWNGLPTDFRAVTGVLLETELDSLRIAIKGKGSEKGRLAVLTGNAPALAIGRTELETKHWYHFALIRNGGKLSVYLNGQLELSHNLSTPRSKGEPILAIGGGSDLNERFEGKIDEVALFDRSLSADEISTHCAGAVGITHREAPTAK